MPGAIITVSQKNFGAGASIRSFTIHEEAKIRAAVSVDSPCRVGSIGEKAVLNLPGQVVKVTVFGVFAAEHSGYFLAGQQIRRRHEDVRFDFVQ